MKGVKHRPANTRQQLPSGAKLQKVDYGEVKQHCTNCHLEKAVARTMLLNQPLSERQWGCPPCQRSY